MDYKKLYDEKKGTVEDCISVIKSDDVVVFAGDANCVSVIQNSFGDVAKHAENVKVFKDHTHYFPYLEDENMKGHIFTQAFFFARDMKVGQPYGLSAFFPADICMNGRFIAANKPTVFIAGASPMDENGNFHIGLCNMWEPETVEYILKTGGRIILEENDQLPRVKGGVDINIKDVTVFIEASAPIQEVKAIKASPEEAEVARNVRTLLNDGDCVQFGIGALPNAIAELCMDLTDLGMHTEMLTSAMAKMVREGVITGKKKNFHTGEHLYSFAGGDKALFETLRTNPNFRVAPASYCCDPFNISKNDNMVSINTCIEMDLTGQIASEAIGPKQHSGSGGAMDYAYGALHSKGGRGIIAFSSKTNKGYSKINTLLREGSMVTIPRNYADYVVTEYGIAHLRAKNVMERAEALINIAHPDFREELRKEAKKLYWL